MDTAETIDELAAYRAFDEVADDSSNALGVDVPLTLAEITQRPAGEHISGIGLVQRSSLKTDRSGATYAALTIRCADGGSIEARWWRFPYAPDHCPQQGVIWRFEGQIDVYQGVPQIRLTAAEPLPFADIAMFVRATRRSLNELQTELELLIAECGEEIGPLVSAILGGEAYERFCEWPAAQTHHGAVRHGLLAHSIRVAHIAQRLASGYGLGMLEHDSELVIAAALLHDVGKIRTLPSVAGGPMPPEAQQMDHVTQSVLMTRLAAESVFPPISQARLERLLHAILAHHGTRDWGAPVEPHTVEAWLVHLADLAEARLWQWSEEA